MVDTCSTRDTTILIIEDVIQDEKKRYSTPYSELFIKRLSEMEEKYRLVLNRSCNIVKNANNHGESFANIIREISRDGEKNFGRFMAAVCLYAKVATSLASVEGENFKIDGKKILLDEYATWIHEHGGWDTYLKQFVTMGDLGNVPIRVATTTFFYYVMSLFEEVIF